MAATMRAQQPGDTPRAQAAIVHAYALAELGRHAEAVKALEALALAGDAQHDDAQTGAALVQERSAYERAMHYTQDCSKDKSCMAEDFLSIGKPSEALGWQKREVRAIRETQNAHLRGGEEHDGGGLRVATGQETDSTGGRSAKLADAYDLQARIEAAMGHQGDALRDLDAAVKALPENAKSPLRQAGYLYHRALVLAEDHQFKKAVQACRESLAMDGTTAMLGERRPLECAAITALGGGNASSP